MTKRTLYDQASDENVDNKSGPIIQSGTKFFEKQMTDSEIEDTRQALLRKLKGLFDAGEMHITEKKGETIISVAPTKTGKRKGKAATSDEINAALDKIGGLKLPGAKRIYRPEEVLLRPELGPKHEQNMPTAKLTPRVSRDHVEIFNTCAENFSSKREALERAIELLARDT